MEVHEDGSIGVQGVAGLVETITWGCIDQLLKDLLDHNTGKHLCSARSQHLPKSFPEDTRRRFCRSGETFFLFLWTTHRLCDSVPTMAIRKVRLQWTHTFS